MTDIESLAIRRKRVLYRVCHRGTQELDILVGGFVADRIDALDSAMLDRIEALLDAEETVLQAWIMGHEPIPPGADAELILAIRAAQIDKVRA